MSALLFWGCIGAVLYTYCGYPALLALRARWWPVPFDAADNVPRVSLIICAHNEEESIGAKLENALALDYPEEALEIIVASDGSTDATVSIARRFEPRGVILLPLPRLGKIPTLNTAVGVARGDVLVFSDANSMYDAGALRALVRPFADPAVGAVAGDQCYAPKRETRGDGTDGERAYWNLDRQLKKWQSCAGSVTSATGAIHAIRSSLFRNLPPGVTDDFWISTNAVAAGYRLVFAPDAIAREPVAGSSRAEFDRKVRVITRGLNGVLQMRRLLDPRHYGFYSLQLFTHKVARRLVAVPLLVLFALGPFVWDEGAFYRVFVLGEVALLVAALAGAAFKGRVANFPGFSVPLYFCMVNFASLVAAVNVARGHRIDSWEPQRAEGGVSTSSFSALEKPSAEDVS